MERWTWDDDAKAGYVYINSGLVTHHTVEIHDGLLVDVDPEGRIVGVEVLDAEGPGDMLTRLANVLEHCRIVEWGEGAEGAGKDE